MALLVSAVTAVSVDAATITVNSFNQVDPGQCTIAVAISSMNAGADQAGCMHAGNYGTSDTIVLAAGTYALTTANNGTNAYPVIQVPVIINGNGATLSRTVGNAPPFFRFFEVQVGGLTINDVTLTGGNVPNGDGGAIFSHGAPLSVNRATFSGNSATSGDGGAIRHSSIEAASITATTFTNNTVSPGGNGGAIHDSSTGGMTVADTTFSGNTANGGDGGAIYDSSTGGLTITNGTFSGNTATGGDGGAIYDSSSGGLEFQGGSVTGNSVGPIGDGGGIYDTSSGGIHITNVLFTGNTAGNGGAIYDNSSVATGPVSGNCIFGNTASSGGGIFRGSSPALEATGNWWGAATGPSGVGPGTGDAVTSNVTFAPFLTSPAASCSSSTTTTTPVAVTTTTTLPSGGCAGTVDGPTFASIICRLDALRQRVGAESGLGAFQPKLAKNLERARSRADEALTFCNGSNRKKTMKRLQQVAKALTQYAHRLAGLAARKKLDDALRQDFLQAGQAITPDVKKLRAQAQCPPA